MNPIDQYWNERPVAKWLMLPVAVVVLGGCLWFVFFNHGEQRSEGILRERGRLSAEDKLDLVDVGAFVRADGSVDRGTTLWCGRVNGDPDRGVAALESQGRRGRVDFLDAAVAWELRSDRERRMIAQCSRVEYGSAPVGQGPA